MNGKIITGIVLLCLGVVLVAVLCGLGGYVKGAIDRTVVSRLKYELPKGYENDPNFVQCFNNTVAAFNDEYYMWNLTNLADVLNGGTAKYNLTGPFSYVEWYCEYDHQVNETGILSYKRYGTGYHFIPNPSSGLDDSALITNVNPGYLAVIAQAGSDTSMAGALLPTFLQRIITSLQSSVSKVWISQFPAVLTGINAVVDYSFFAQDINGVSASAFFSAGYSTPKGLQGFTTFANANYAGVPVSFAAGTQAALLAVYNNPTTHVAFLQTSDTAINGTYNVTLQQADILLAYSSYIYATLAPSVYSQWANGTTTVKPNWEIGIPTSTNMSAADVATLFSKSSACSLSNATTFQKTWAVAYFLNSISVLSCPDLTLTDAQKQTLVAYVGSFTQNTVVPTLQTKLNFSDWDNFGYAQWGQLITGATLGNTADTPYAPEAAAAGAKFTVAQAKELLNGTYGLFQLSNMRQFIALATTAQYPLLFATWPSLGQNDFAGLINLQAFASTYMQGVLIPSAIAPVLQTEVFDKGGGLFTTRTVREWMFTAEDPLLVFLGQAQTNVGLKKNTTITKAESETANLTMVRVFTGSNDLHWSLMPINEGEQLSIWRGDVRVTGYNGSQFLPNGYVDSGSGKNANPLTLYHKDITRPIPFQNLGKDSWDGIDVRYLTLSDDALQNQVLNPVNYAYYAEYSGAINKTSNPPNLPVFLTTPNFYSADPYYYQNINFTDLIWEPTYDKTDKFSRHRLSLFILVEPKLGSTVWGNLPIQINFKYGKGSLFYTKVVDAYAPIYWNAIGDIATSHDLDLIKDDLYKNIVAWKALVGVGAGVGGSLIIIGMALIIHFKRHENELKEYS